MVLPALQHPRERAVGTRHRERSAYAGRGREGFADSDRLCAERGGALVVSGLERRIRLVRQQHDPKVSGRAGARNRRLRLTQVERRLWATRHVVEVNESNPTTSGQVVLPVGLGGPRCLLQGLLRTGTVAPVVEHVCERQARRRFETSVAELSRLGDGLVCSDSRRCEVAKIHLRAEPRDTLGQHIRLRADGGVDVALSFPHVARVEATLHAGQGAGGLHGALGRLGGGMRQRVDQRVHLSPAIFEARHLGVHDRL